MTQENTTEKTTKTTTLGEHRGLWLATDKTIRFKPWKGRVEAELAEVLQKNRKKMEGGRVCKRASLILQHMICEVDGNVFWAATEERGIFKEMMPQVQREHFIRSMYQTDVLIAYFLLRMASIDPIVDLKFKSPYDSDGERECSWKGDLSELPIVGSSNISDCIHEYKFQDETEIRGKIVSSLVLGPPKWGVAEDLKLMSPGPVELKIMAASIVKVPDFSNEEGITFSIEDLYDVSKRDLNGLSNAIEDQVNGLDLSIEVFDSEAEKTFESSLNWMDPDFFGSSSRS